MAIVRAVRALGHPCRLVNVVGWSALWRAADARGWCDWPRLRARGRPSTRQATSRASRALRALTPDARAASGTSIPSPRPSSSRSRARSAGCTSPICAQVEAYREAGVSRMLDSCPRRGSRRRLPGHATTPSRFLCEASFVGSGQYPHRHELLRAVSGVCRLQIRGPGWEQAPADLPVAGGPVWGQRLRRGDQRRGDLPRRPAPYPEQERTGRLPPTGCGRSWAAAGSTSGPQCRTSSEFAVGRRHCAWYRDLDEAVALAEHYLAAPEERARIAAAGREHALSRHTYAHRLQLLLARGSSVQLRRWCSCGTRTRARR